MLLAARRSPLPFLGGLLALYIAVPVGAFAVRVVASGAPGFGTPGLFDALYVSALTATISTAIVAAVGLPLAYVLSLARSRLAAVVGVVVYLPLALPPLMSGILLIYIVGPYTSIGRLFGGRLTESLAGIVIAQCFVAAPFLVVAARSAMGAIDPSLYEKAATLGHGELRRFWLVALPVAWGGIRAGLLLTWLRAFGEYGATVIIAYHPYSLPVFTYLQFSGTGLPNTEAPTVLALLVAVTVVTLSRLRPRRRRRPPAPPPTRPSSPTRPGTDNTVAFELDHQLGEFHLHCAYVATTPRLAILGASGAGKSATLRCIAGLLGPGPGRVFIGGREVTEVPVETRNVGYVPQGLALLPHLPVWRQLLFGSGADAGLARYWLERLHLGGIEHRYPHELSGGQRQRVSLAQALTRSPELVLLDEPFSALDAPVRAELRQELRRLQNEAGLSTVLVTHDPEEAAMLADDIIVISDGRVLQAGPRSEVFGAPASPEVARLLGIANISPGVVVAAGELSAIGTRLRAPTGDCSPGTRVLWSVRPEYVEMALDGPPDAVVLDAMELGAARQLVLDTDSGDRLLARPSNAGSIEVGSRVRVVIPPEAIRLWPTT